MRIPYLTRNTLIILIGATTAFIAVVSYALHRSEADIGEWMTTDVFLYLAGAYVLLVMIYGGIKWVRDKGDYAKYVSLPFWAGLFLVGALVFLIGTDLTGDLLGKIQENAENAAERLTGGTSPGATPEASWSLPELSWEEPFWHWSALLILVLLALVALRTSAKVRIVWGVAGTLILLPFLLWLAWGALPEDFTDGVELPSVSVPWGTPRHYTWQERQVAEFCDEQDDSALGEVTDFVGLTAPGQPFRIVRGGFSSLGMCPEMADDRGIITKLLIVPHGTERSAVRVAIEEPWREAYPPAQGAKVAMRLPDSPFVERWPNDVIGYAFPHPDRYDMYVVMIPVQKLLDRGMEAGVQLRVWG